MNRKCRKMNYAFDKNFVVNNEKLVIETSAQLVLEEDEIEGVLALTDKRYPSDWIKLINMQLYIV